MVKIGVLALQGAVSEHIRSIENSGADALMVKNINDLALVDGLILPGGESTAIRKLIDRFEMLEPLRQFALDGKPMFGTCAGLILLAKELVGYDYSHVGELDAIVERNSYGRQVDSFEIDLNIKGVATDYPAVFIRAPHIVSVEENVEILATHGDRIVMVKQGHLLGCSFHPELTDDHRIMAYFIEMVKESLANEVPVQ